MEKELADEVAILAQQRQERQKNGTLKNSSGVGGYAGGYAEPGDISQDNSQFMRRIGAISLVLHLVPVGYMAFQLGLFDMIWTRNVTYGVIGMHVFFAAAGYGAVHFSMPKTREFMVFCVLIVCMCWGAFYFLGGGCVYETFRGDISFGTAIWEEGDAPTWYMLKPLGPRENAGITCRGFHETFSKYKDYKTEDKVRFEEELTDEAYEEIGTWREALPKTKFRDLYDLPKNIHTGDHTWKRFTNYNWYNTTKTVKDNYYGLPKKYTDKLAPLEKGKVDLFLWMQYESVRTRMNDQTDWDKLWGHKDRQTFEENVEKDADLKIVEDWIKAPFPTEKFLFTSAIIGIASAIVCSAVVGFQA